MRLSLALFFLIISTISFSQTKEAQHPIDKKLDECMAIDSNQTTVGMMDCTGIAKGAWDKELNKYYKLLIGILSEEEKLKLKESQRKWLEYRDKEFDFSGTTYYNLGGTMWHIVAANREYEMVKQRALDLKEYYEVFKENK